MTIVAARRFISPWAGGLVALALGAGGCGGGASSASPSPAGGQSATSASVSVASFKFMPRSLTVAVGTEVTWTNEDSAPHTATDTDRKAFDTGTLRKGQSKTIVVKDVGTYSYVCEFHPFMTATLVVR